MRLNIPLLDDDTVSFNSTLFAIVRHSLKINTLGTVHVCTHVVMATICCCHGNCIPLPWQLYTSPWQLYTISMVTIYHFYGNQYHFHGNHVPSPWQPSPWQPSCTTCISLLSFLAGKLTADNAELKNKLKSMFPSVPKKMLDSVIPGESG